MLRTSNPSENPLNKIVEDDEVVGKSKDSGHILAESKKSKNHRILAKSKKAKHQPKSSKSKKAILDKSEISVNLTVATNADAMGYLTPKAREAFTQLRQAFTKAPILRHFDPECHIRIETDASGYAIGGVLSQLNSDWVAPDSSKLNKSDFG